MNPLFHFRPLVLTALTVVLLSACSSSVRAPAPVEDRSPMGRTSTSANNPVTSTSVDASKPMPGSENAGKPGYHTVQRGETLTRIGLDNGQGWRDLARWNQLSNPDVIEVGQVLRVSPPGAAVETPGVVVRPIAQTNASASSVSPPKPEPAPSANQPSGNDEGLGFIWPANGALIAGFDEAKNKGLDIAGKAGDAIVASADGQVVYAGAGLRGYGNLIILKHNNTFLTAYAHNQALLVKEDQKVRKGQKIAEMGKSDADRVKLHFEVRRQGKPVDPAKLLPAR
ncbi:peptidoglycan DD-metalloendopeptidase family protein [Limnohabitans sp. 15K]|uniref:peptidoglycan DD-metalloendopeptidase family protein n=1 Tax=Limnohabitans sp. 15K TaxID=1100706 RepID=UPI000C1E51EC|nr:peptidoglycan DD-metalloendopeptidase family protein [Limnohabitans sp. 15K]PIT81806.1 peptidase M23 [Limnohabitans sp. 15K]